MANLANLTSWKFLANYLLDVYVLKHGQFFSRTKRTELKKRVILSHIMTDTAIIISV